MSLNATIKSLFGRNHLIPATFHDLQCLRRIKLLRRKNTTRVTHLREDRQLFGKVFVTAKMKKRVNVDLKHQPSTEVFHIKKATLNPWRLLMRKDGWLHPGQPTQLMRLASTVLNKYEALFHAKQCVRRSGAKLEENLLPSTFKSPLHIIRHGGESMRIDWRNSIRREGLFPHKVSDDTKLSLQNEDVHTRNSAFKHESSYHNMKNIQLPQIPKRVDYVPLFHESINDTQVHRTSNVKLYRTLADNKDFQNIPSIAEVLSKTKHKLSSNVYQRILENSEQRGKEESIEKEYQKTGIDMHSYMKQILCDEESQVSDENTLILKSLKNQFKYISDVKAAAVEVKHSMLHYKGYVDSVASYKGLLSVIEWIKTDKKTSTNLSISDVPVQVAANIGAINTSENYPFIIKKGIIIVAFSSGKTAHVLELNEHKLKDYWLIWQWRLQCYYTTISPMSIEMKYK